MEINVNKDNFASIIGNLKNRRYASASSASGHNFSWIEFEKSIPLKKRILYVIATALVIFPFLGLPFIYAKGLRESCRRAFSGKKVIEVQCPKDIEAAILALAKKTPSVGGQEKDSRLPEKLPKKNVPEIPLAQEAPLNLEKKKIIQEIMNKAEIQPTSLKLDDQKLNGDTLKSLLEAALEKSKKRVNDEHFLSIQLKNAEIDAEGARQIAEFIQAIGGVTTINLSNNSIGDEGVLALAKAMEAHPFKTMHLNLSSNQISPNGIEALIPLCKNPVTLSLCSNNLKNEGALKLIEGVLSKDNPINSNSKGLLSINLGNNEINDELIDKIIEAICKAKNITPADLKKKTSRMPSSSPKKPTKNHPVVFKFNNIAKRKNGNSFECTSLAIMKQISEIVPLQLELKIPEKKNNATQTTKALTQKQKNRKEKLESIKRILETRKK